MCECPAPEPILTNAEVVVGTICRACGRVFVRDEYAPKPVVKQDPLYERKCAYKPCSERFMVNPRTRPKKFCSAQHARMAARRGKEWIDE